MIFVTVGTHEDPFNRLVKEIDRLKEVGCLQEEVFVQTGYSTYLPIHCQQAVLLSYLEMDTMMKEARIVITHGGPGSIMHSLRYKKVPIVVPRRKEFGEHVDNHQVYFSQRLEQAHQALVVLEISELEKVITDYESSTRSFNLGGDHPSNVDNFVAELETITRRLLKGKV